MIPYILAGLLFLLGLPQVIWPYKIARFEEQIDAIGSKRSWSEVEPADWKVGLTKLIGFGLIFLGVIIFVLGLI